MTLLLDTNAFLWFCQDHPMLSSKAKALIEDPANRKVVSIATCWEIAIKVGLGKLNLGESSFTYIQNALAKTMFDLLPISLVHATAVELARIFHEYSNFAHINGSLCIQGPFSLKSSFLGKVSPDPHHLEPLFFRISRLYEGGCAVTCLTPSRFFKTVSNNSR